MLKTIKKWLFAAVAAVVTFLSFFIFFGHNTAKAETKVGLTSQNVERSEESSTKVTEFKGYMAYFTGITVEEGMISTATLAKAYTNAKSVITKNPAINFAVECEEEYNLFLDVDAWYSSAYQVYLGVESLYEIASDEYTVTFADNDKVDGVQNAYNALTDSQKTYVDLATDDLEYLKIANEKMDAREQAISDAKDAIDAILYYNVSDSTLKVYDPSLTADDQYVVLGSETTIADAEAKVTAIENDKSYVENLDMLTAAREALDAWKQKAIDLDSKIEGIYGDIVVGKVYFTLNNRIVEARNEYTALADTTGFNDVQSLVTKLSVLEEMEQAIIDIQAEIDNVESLITAISGVEAKYNDVYNTVIKTAEDAFELLDEDIVNHDTTATEGWFVENYSAMVSARAQYDAWEQEVKGLVADVEEMIETEKNLGDWEKICGALDIKLTEITEEQEIVFNSSIVSYNEEDKTCEEIFKFFKNKAAKIPTIVTPVITAIDELGAFSIDPDYILQLDAVNSLYNELDDEYKYYVSNYEKLEELNGKLESAMAVVKTWQDAVALIESPVTITNKGLVENAIAAYNALEANYQTIIGSASMYATEWAAYESATADLEALLEEIKDVADLMSSTSIDTENEVAIDQVATWYNTVDGATAAFNNLADDQKEYLQANYVNEYANYQRALELYAKYSVEGKIAEIDAVIKLASKQGILDARAAFDAYVGADTIRNIQVLLDAENALAEITADLNAWMIEVCKFIDANVSDEASLTEIEAILATDISGIYSVDLDAVEVVLNNYALVNTDTDTEAYLATAKAKLDAIKDLGNKRVDDLNTAISELPAVLTKNEIEKIEEIEATYGKLHDTQKELVNYSTFEASYNKLIATGVVIDMIDSLHTDAVVNGNVTATTAVSLGLIKTTYGLLSTEYKELVTNYDKVTEVEKAIADAEEILALNKVKEDLETKLDELKDSLTAYVDGEIADLDTALKGYADGIVSDLEISLKAYVDGEVTELEQALADAVSALENADATNKTALEGLISDLEDALADAKLALESKDADILDQLAKAIVDLEKADADLKEELKAYVDGEVTELEQALADAVLALENADATNKTALEGLISDLEDALADAKLALEAKDADILDQLAKAIVDLEKADAELKEELTAYVDAEIKDLEDALNKAKEELAKADVDNKEELTALINGVQANLDAVKASLDAKDTDILSQLAKAVSTLENADAELKAYVDAEIKALEDALNKAKEELAKADVDNKEELTALINGVQANLDAVKASLDAKDADILSQLATAVSTLENADAELKAEIERIESEYKNADAELQKQIDSLKGKITAITVVFSILIAGIAACVVVLFVKGKKNS